MDWFKLSSRYADDPRVVQAGEAAEVLFIRAAAYIAGAETDGFVPLAVVQRLAPRWQPRAVRLVQVGLWVKVEGGYQVPGYLKHNPSKADLDRRRAVERGRRSRERAANVPPTCHQRVSTSAQTCATEVEVEEEQVPLWLS